MKAAKKLVLCTLAMLLLVSFYCVNTSAYILGGTTFRDANGNAHFSIAVSNANIQTLRYTAYAELEKASGTNYTFGACFASIYGRDTTTGALVEYDGENVLDFYYEAQSIWEEDAAYFAGSGYSSCEHSISITRRDSFTPLFGKGYAIVGYLDNDGDYVFVHDELDGVAGHQRKYFTPVWVKDVSYAWVTGDDGFIQMSN